MNLKKIILFIILSSSLYGVTFQYYKVFSENASIQGDREIYYNLSKERSDEAFVNAVQDADHRLYRQLIPQIVKYTYKFIHQANEELQNRFDIKFFENDFDLRLFIFYFINFIFTLLTSLLLYKYLYKLDYPEAYCLIGALLFMSSRVITYSIGSPLVDSISYFGIILIFYIIITNVSLLFFIFGTALALLSKETILLFLFLIFFNKHNLSFGRISYVIFILISYFLYKFLIVDYYSDILSTQFWKSGQTEEESYLFFHSTISDQLPYIKKHYKELFSIHFYYKLFHGFGLIYLVGVVSLIAFFKNLPNKLNIIYFYTFIASLILGLFSFSEGGRILFSCSFVAIIHLVTKTLKYYFENEMNKEKFN